MVFQEPRGQKLVLESHVFNPFISVFGFWCISETFVVLLFASEPLFLASWDQSAL